MKSTVTIAAAALLTAISLCGCADNASLVKLTYGNDRFVNESASLSYDFAPLCYEPMAIGDPYAFCEDPAVTFCEIPGLAPADWLTEEYAGSATTILHSDEITLPSLGEMDADTVYVCMVGERVFSLITIEEKDAIRQLTSTFEMGESTSLPHTEANLTYSLKFASKKGLPGLYYTLIYSEYAEGTFLSVQGSDRCVEIGNLFNEILDSQASETEETSNE